MVVLNLKQAHAHHARLLDKCEFSARRAASNESAPAICRNVLTRQEEQAASTLVRKHSK